MTPPDATLSGRVARLGSVLGDLDGYLAVDPANVRWLTGLAGEGHVLYANTPLCAVVGPTGEVRLVAHACELGWLDERIDVDAVEAYGRFVYQGAVVPPALLAVRAQRPLAGAIARALEAVGAGARIGVDDGIGASALARLTADLADRELVPAADLPVRARRLKDEYELERMRAANEIAENAIATTVACAAPGMEEGALLRALRTAMLERGARPMLGSVGIGERGALVDTVPSSRVLRAGDVVRFDVGCTVDGYHSDLARTVSFGEPSHWTRDAYAALLAGERAAIEAVRPGVTGAELFDAAVGATRAAGLDGYDRSHCGHGIGLQIYEPPLLAPGADEPIEAGMTMCVETPHYVLGVAGLQVEDAIVVRADGAERLGRAAQELVVVA